MTRLLDEIAARWGRLRPMRHRGQRDPFWMADERLRLLRAAGVHPNEITDEDVDEARWLRDHFRLDEHGQWQALERNEDDDGEEWTAPSDAALARVAEANRSSVMGVSLVLGGTELLTAFHDLQHAADDTRRDRELAEMQAQCDEMQAERERVDGMLVEEYERTGERPAWWRPSLRAQQQLREIDESR